MFTKYLLTLNNGSIVIA